MVTHEIRDLRTKSNTRLDEFTIGFHDSMHIHLLYLLESTIHFGEHVKYRTLTTMPQKRSVLPDTSFNNNKMNMRSLTAYSNILIVRVVIWQILVSFLRLEQWPIRSSVVLVGQWPLDKRGKNALVILGSHALLAGDQIRWIIGPTVLSCHD